MGVRVKQRNGAWWVYVDHKRQRKAKRVGIGQAGKRAVEEVAKAYEVQLTLGTFDFSKPASMTLLAYSGDWLNTHGLTLKLGTREKHAEVLRVHWLPTLGPVALDSITRQQVKSIAADKARIRPWDSFLHDRRSAVLPAFRRRRWDYPCQPRRTSGGPHNQGTKGSPGRGVRSWSVSIYPKRGQETRPAAVSYRPTTH